MTFRTAVGRPLSLLLGTWIDLRGKTQSGAGNETRTRDPDLGKVVLYQLSYSRLELIEHRHGTRDPPTLARLGGWRPLGESNPCRRDENPVS